MTFAHIWYTWDLAFVVLSFYCDFNSNFFMKLTTFLHDYFLKVMSTLKYPKPMIGECSSEV